MVGGTHVCVCIRMLLLFNCTPGSGLIGHEHESRSMGRCMGASALHDNDTVHGWSTSISLHNFCLSSMASSMVSWTGGKRALVRVNVDAFDLHLPYS